MSEDSVELLRQLQERDRTARTQGEVNARRAAATEAENARKAARELEILVAILKKDGIPTQPLYKFKKKRMGWNTDYEVFQKIDSVWLVTTITGEDGSGDKHWVLTPHGTLFGPTKRIPRRDHQKAFDGPGFEWQNHNAPLPASELFISQGSQLFSPRWKLAVSAQETANIYHWVIDLNIPR